MYSRRISSGILGLRPINPGASRKLRPGFFFRSVRWVHSTFFSHVVLSSLVYNPFRCFSIVQKKYIVRSQHYRSISI